MDQFFKSLLLDQRILYSSYVPETRLLELTYDDTLYELSLAGFVNLYPNRKKYTLQTAGLYYLACILRDFTPSFLREDIVTNYERFRQINRESRTDFVSLVLICIPSFLLTVIREDTANKSEEVMREYRFYPPKKKYKLSRSGEDSNPGGVYILVVVMGAITIVSTSVLLLYLIRYRAPENIKHAGDSTSED